MSSPDREDPNYPAPTPVVASDYLDAINRPVTTSPTPTPAPTPAPTPTPYTPPTPVVSVPAPVVASDYVDAINRNVASQVVAPVVTPVPIVAPNYVDAINRPNGPEPFPSAQIGTAFTPAIVQAPAPVVPILSSPASDYLDAINRPVTRAPTPTPAPKPTPAPLSVSVPLIPIDAGYDALEASRTPYVAPPILSLQTGKQPGSDNVIIFENPDGSIKMGGGSFKPSEMVQAPPVLKQIDPALIKPDTTRAGELAHYEMNATERILVDLKYYDMNFENVAEAGRDWSSQGFASTDQLKAEGNAFGAFTAIGSSAVRFGVGVFEGATFLIRPDMWFQTGKMVVGLGQDLGAYLGTGVPASGVSGQMRRGIEADPLGFALETSGNVVGGYVAGKAVGGVVDRLTGGKAVRETATGLEVESTVRDNIKGADFTATVERKTVPGTVGEIMRGETVSPDLDVRYRTLTGDIKYKPSPGESPQITGLLGTTDDPIKAGVKITGIADDVDSFFKPDNSGLSLTQKIKNRLGFLDDTYESKPTFVDDAVLERYTPPPDNPIDKLFVSKDTPTETFQYKPGYDITATDVDSTITRLERGSPGGFKDFKEVGPEGGVWGEVPEYTRPIGGEGGSWVKAPFEPEGAPHPGAGLTDTTRYKLIAGITDDAGKLIDDLDLGDMRVEPEAGPKTPLSTTFGPDDGRMPGPKATIKAIDDVKAYIKSGGSGGVSEGGGPGGLSKLDLIEMGVQGTTPITRATVNAGSSVGSTILGTVGGVASGFRASLGGYGGSDSVLLGAERDVGDIFKSTRSTPVQDRGIVSQGTRVPALEDLVRGTPRVDPIQRVLPSDYLDSSQRPVTRGISSIKPRVNPVSVIDPFSRLDPKVTPIVDVFTRTDPRVDPVSVIDPFTRTTPRITPEVDVITRIEPRIEPVYKPISIVDPFSRTDPVVKPISVVDNVPIQKVEPWVTPVTRTPVVEKTIQVQDPILDIIQIPVPYTPSPTIITPKPFTFFPTRGGGGGGRVSRGLGLGGAENRKYFLASPGKMLKGLRKRRSII